MITVRSKYVVVLQLLAAVTLAVSVISFPVSVQVARGETVDGPMLERPDQEGQYVPGRLLVKVKPGVSVDEADALRAGLQATVLKRFSLTGVELWEIRATTVKQGLTEYSSDSRIEYMEPDFAVHAIPEGGSLEVPAGPLTTPNDPSFPSLWGLHNTGQTGGIADADIDALEAWDIQTGGNVVVAVIDTGVDYNHEDLVDNMWTNPGEIPGNSFDDDGNGYVDDVYGWDFAYGDNDPMDGHSHGTHCAGTIAGVGNNGIGVVGVSWSAKIMAIKFLDDTGSGWSSDAVSAIEYAVLMGAQLTSNSWGGGGYSQTLRDTIAAAGAEGQLFIAAAGNDYGNDNDANPHYPSSYSLDNIIAVASTDHNDSLSGFSSYGATSVDLGAPGSNIYSSVPGDGYGTKSGTSMATPHVSGAVSLVWSEFPGLVGVQVKQMIMDSVDPIPSLTGKTVTGGRLNAYAALAGSPPPPQCYDLDATADPASSGSVTVDQPPNCADGQQYVAGTQVGLTANATPGHYFSNWSGDASGSSNPTTVTMNNNRSVTAHFTQQCYGLTISANPSDGGSVSADPQPNCTGGLYAAGTQVILTAIPSSGHYFANWSGDASGIDNPTTLTVDGDRSAAANFIVPFIAPFSDDMESGTNGWTATGFWHQVEQGVSPYPEASSPTHSWWYGQDSTGNYADGSSNSGDLTSPPIYIPDPGYSLSFWYWYQTEDADTIWDQKWVQVSVDGGPFNNSFQVTGEPTQTWVRSLPVDLSAYAGSTVRFRFHFDTIDGVYNDFRGWYIDDVAVSTQCSDPNEPNDAWDQATSIAYGTTLTGPDICPAGDADYYAFSGNAGDLVVADIDAQAIGSSLDSYLYLNDTDGVTELTHNDDFDGLDSRITYVLPADGTYYLMVQESNDGSEGGPGYFYDITLSRVTCNDPHEPNDGWNQATSIAYGDNLTDPDICPEGDVDYYSFSGNAGDLVVADTDAQAIGSSLDSYLYLYDTDGVTNLTQNDDFDGFDSRITYVLPADGTFYLMVREYSHGSEGGPDYFYTVSLSLLPPPPPPFDVDANWTSSAPNVDGQISGGEWDAAATYDITVGGLGSLSQRTPATKAPPQIWSQERHQPEEAALTMSSLSTVTLYVMNDDAHLYLAMDDPNDATIDDWDQMGVYFDDNPLPSDGRWTNTSCGHPDGEGNFWVMTNTTIYREWIAGPTACDVIMPAPGTAGTVRHASGHAQAEIAIDLTASALRAIPGDGIKMYLWILDDTTGAFDGKWPITADFQNPATYGLLTLAVNNPLITTYTISGQVTDSAGSGIAGVTVTASGTAGLGASATPTTVTDSTGYYTLMVETTGTYLLTFSKTGYAFEPVTATVSASNPNPTADAPPASPMWEVYLPTILRR